MTVSEEEIIGFLKRELGEDLIDAWKQRERRAVSYTHLTLPTN